MINIDYITNFEIIDVLVDDSYKKMDISKRLNLLKQCICFFEAKYTYEMNGLHKNYLKNNKKYNY